MVKWGGETPSNSHGAQLLGIERSRCRGTSFFLDLKLCHVIGDADESIKILNPISRYHIRSSKTMVRKKHICPLSYNTSESRLKKMKMTSE